MMLGNLVLAPKSLPSPAAALQVTPIAGVGASGSGRNTLDAGLAAVPDFVQAAGLMRCDFMNEPGTGGAFAKVRSLSILALPAWSFSRA
jgi:hypothetical protein